MSDSGTLPDFLIIGAMKSGTNTLYDYFGQHPDVRRCMTHEPHFFDNRFGRGAGWYRAQFPRLTGSGPRRWVTGEASPYYLFHPLAPERAASVVPHAGIVAVLRNPVDRAYSHYQHQVSMGRESLSFEQALDEEPRRTAEAWRDLANGRIDRADSVQHFSYLARGRYAEQLARWREHYPSEQLAVVRAEDLHADPVSVMRRLFAFIGVAPLEELVLQRLNARDYPPLDQRHRDRLNRYFREPVRRLADFLGTDVWWEL